MPTVTVVIPAYNAESYISEALCSIQKQTYDDKEVILIDDGSSDGTLQEARRFDGLLDLKIMRQENAGQGAARNAGIREARGRYCAFLDADDVMLPERLAAQTKLLQTDNELGFIHTDLMTFDEQGTIHRTRWAFSEPCGGWILDRLLLQNFVTTSTVMAPTERLIEVGLFDERRGVSEDFDLWLRMAARWKVGFINRPLIRYRYRRGSFSDNKIDSAYRRLKVIEAFWRDHSNYFKSHQKIRRQSLGRTLVSAGAAALSQKRRATALQYLLRSLRYEPGAIATWKWLVKTIVFPSRRLASRHEQS